MEATLKLQDDNDSERYTSIAAHKQVEDEHKCMVTHTQHTYVACQYIIVMNVSDV